MTLDKYETYAVGYASGDLTGSLIYSSNLKPFFAASGNEKIAVGSGSADHLVEQLPPTDTWGSKFIISSIPSISSEEKYRFIASEDDTVVTVRNGETAISSQTITNAGGFFEIDLPNDVEATVVATRPILVVQFERSGGAIGDPSMQIIPPINLYASDFTFPYPDAGTLKFLVNFLPELLSFSL